MPQKNPTEEVRLLRTAASEISSLRRSNQLMSARLQMFDDMMLVFRTNIPHSGLQTQQDVVYDINHYLNQLEPK